MYMYSQIISNGKNSIQSTRIPKIDILCVTIKNSSTDTSIFTKEYFISLAVVCTYCSMDQVDSY